MKGLESVTPILNVSDMDESLAWFETLGWRRSFTWNTQGTIAGAANSDQHGGAQFAGVIAGDVTLFLCQDGQGSRGGSVPRHTTHDETGGVWMSLWFDSVNALEDVYQLAQQADLNVPFAPRDEPWGVREFFLRHPDGHTFRISASLDLDD